MLSILFVTAGTIHRISCMRAAATVLPAALWFCPAAAAVIFLHTP